MSKDKQNVRMKKRLSPKLRFKEFDGKWTSCRLGDGIDLVSGQHLTPTEYNNSNAGFPYFTGPSDFTDVPEKVSKWTTASSHFGLKGDVLITVKGNGVGKMTIQHLEKVAMGRQLMSISSVHYSSEFVFHFLLTKLNLFVALASGNLIPGLSRKDILSIKINIPSLTEQKKIANFLSTIDEKLQQLTRKKELLEAYKKGLMQQLFSGELRFTDEEGKDYPDWEPRKMSDVLYEHKLKSTGTEEVFSVSVHKGLINQIEHLGRVYAAKNTDNYNRVQPNDIVYTKSPTGDFPLGIIKQSKVDKEVIVSPLYGIFEPETPGLGYLLNVHFESPINTHNYLASIIQKGAKNTINITNTTFLSKKMRLPILKEEQQKIGKFLYFLDFKIDITNNQITKAQTFKKGLLQQMFV